MEYIYFGRILIFAPYLIGEINRNLLPFEVTSNNHERITTLIMSNPREGKILLLGPRLVRALGGASLLFSTIEVLHRYIPTAHFTFISPTEEDLELSDCFGVNIIPVTNMWKILIPAIIKALFGMSLGSKDIRHAVDAFSNTDLVIQMWGIWFADQLGGNKLKTRINHSVYFWVAKLFNKPMVKYTADLGPFNFRWNRFFAKSSLQYFTDLILARNNITLRRLKELGVTTPTLVCPDTAFLLKSETTIFADELQELRTAHPIVGISVSHQGARQSGNPEKYIQDMANLADFIAFKYAAKILLIPNEVSDDQNYDDVYFVSQVHKYMKHQNQTIIVSGGYSAPELKGIINQCDAVVASRYHTIVASLSHQIPVLVLGWHEKYLGVLELVGQEKYLFSVDSYDVNELYNRFNELWESREQIRKQIGDSLPRITEDIYQGGKAVHDILKKDQRL